MSFQTYIENLRAKPDHKKKQFAFWTSFGFSLVLFVFWISTFSFSGNRSDSIIANVADKAGSPAQSLVAGIGSIFDSVKSYFISPRVIEYKSLEAVPGK